jgi:hypothetical protein
MRAPSSIMPLAAPGGPILFGAALALRPLRVARAPRWCDHEYPRWGGHNALCVARLPVFGAPASLIMGRNSLEPGSGPSHRPTPKPQGVSYVQIVVVYIRNIIPVGT